MTRNCLLATTAALAVAFHAAARADQPVNGEGATSVIGSFNAEFALDKSYDPAFTLKAYPTTSAKGKTAFFNNAGTSGSGVPAGVPVDFSLSDAAITSADLSTYAGLDQATDGALIQIPMIGVPITIPFTDPGVSTNGGLRLTDTDLCGIFSGKIQNFAQLSYHPAGGSSGAFQVVYRQDSAGTTFLLTEHLGKVCTTANSNFTSADLASMPTSTFTALSTTANLPNAIAANGINGEASAVAAAPAAIGWVSPDHTSIAATPAPGYGSLLVAAVRSPNGTYYLPTYTNTSTALSGAQKNAINATAPTDATAADQTKWLPQLPQPQTGYPIVGYTTWVFATCYQSGKADAIRSFLGRHFETNGPYKKTITNNGYLPVTNAGYVAAIRKYFLTSTSLNLDIGDPTACAGKTGR